MFSSQRGSQPETAHRKSPLKNPLLYSSLAIATVLVYLGWVLLVRWRENRAIERQAALVRSEQQREQDRIAIEQLGGSEMSIQMFYADPPLARRGESVSLCYGVANAKNVSLEPQDNPVWPSHNHCVNVILRKETVYTLTIDDGRGHSQSQSLTVKVR
jgi:hypothetical protein